jgi:hypothetical protein
VTDRRNRRPLQTVHFEAEKWEAGGRQELHPDLKGPAPSIAASVRNLASELFPGAIQIIDRFHARENLSQAAKATSGLYNSLGRNWAAAALEGACKVVVVLCSSATLTATSWPIYGLRAYGPSRFYTLDSCSCRWSVTIAV